MNLRISDFLTARSAETYPEPRSEGHDGIIATVCPMVAEKLPPGAQVLDVGCGQGPALQWFKERGFDAIGIGINEEDLSQCRDGRGLVAINRDMHDLSHAWTGGFDCVFARHVLEHSIAPFFVLNEFARILKPGALLYVEVPSPDTSCNHEANQNHYSVMGFRMWGSLIHRAGFGEVLMNKLSLQTGAGPDEYFAFFATKS